MGHMPIIPSRIASNFYLALLTFSWITWTAQVTRLLLISVLMMDGGITTVQRNMSSESDVECQKIAVSSTDDRSRGKEG